MYWNTLLNLTVSITPIVTRMPIVPHTAGSVTPNVTISLGLPSMMVVMVGMRKVGIQLLFEVSTCGGIGERTEYVFRCRPVPGRNSGLTW